MAHYHGHRYHKEQDALLAAEQSPAQLAIQKLDARLKSIATAENALASDLTPHFARQTHVRTLGNRSVGEARAEAYRTFRLEYSAAVDAEGLAA